MCFRSRQIWGTDNAMFAVLPTCFIVSAVAERIQCEAHLDFYPAVWYDEEKNSVD